MSLDVGQESHASLILLGSAHHLDLLLRRQGRLFVDDCLGRRRHRIAEEEVFVGQVGAGGGLGVGVHQG